MKLMKRALGRFFLKYFYCRLNINCRRNVIVVLTFTRLNNNIIFHTFGWAAEVEKMMFRDAPQR